MEAAYVIRKQQLLEECQVAPEIFHQVMPRLETFMAPFVDTFCRQEASQHAQTYVCGLLSDVERQNVESIAYWFGQDRLPLQRFIGWAEWDDEPLRQALIGQVASNWGTTMGCWSSTPRPSPNPGPNRWAWRGNGVVVWAKSITVKWPSLWATSRPRATPWWTCGCPCPKNGPKIRPA